MFQELVQQHLKKLKTFLRYRFYFIFTILLLLFCYQSDIDSAPTEVSLSGYVSDILDEKGYKFVIDNHLFTSRKSVVIGDYVNIQATLINVDKKYYKYLRSKNMKGYYSIQEITYVDKTNLLLLIKRKLINHLNKYDYFGFYQELVLARKGFSKETSELISNLHLNYLFALSGLHVMLLYKSITKFLSIFKIP